jgi:outer membrane lipoprotein SlyB
MKTLRSAIAILAFGALAGCASAVGQGGPPVGAEPVEYGVVTQVEAVSLEGDHQLGLGTVLGATAGGVIGHQIGRGAGRDVATVVGVIGGGLAGNAIENRYVDRRPGQQIFVRLQSGATVAVTQPGESGLRAGDYVMVKGSGSAARVSRN